MRCSRDDEVTWAREASWSRTDGVTVFPVQVDIAEQLDAAFDRIRQERADGLMVAGSAITYGYHHQYSCVVDREQIAGDTLSPNGEAD